MWGTPLFPNHPYFPCQRSSSCCTPMNQYLEISGKLCPWSATLTQSESQVKPKTSCTEVPKQSSIVLTPKAVNFLLLYLNLIPAPELCCTPWSFLPSNLKPDPSPTIRRPGKRHKLTTHMEASINGATSTFQIIQILVGCSLANHLFWGSPTASWKPPHPQSGEISASSAPTSSHGCQVCPSPSQRPPWPPPPSASLRTR